MPIVFQKQIHRLDLVMNRHVTYVFGDNDQRAGWGGQAAECRAEENAHGIRTKKAPKTGAHVYYRDAEYLDNCRKIDEDFEPLFEMMRENPTRIIVWPSDGIGTGFARLSSTAPRTLKHIEDKLRDLICVANGFMD